MVLEVVCIHSSEPLNVSLIKSPLILKFLFWRNDWTCRVLSSSWIHRMQLCAGCCICDHINNTRRILYVWLQHQPSGHSTFVSITEAIVNVWPLLLYSWSAWELSLLAIVLYRPGMETVTMTQVYSFKHCICKKCKFGREYDMNNKLAL